MSIKTKTNIINEDLSKNLKNLLRSAAEKMSSELGISLEEALYVTSLYGELKDKDLFKASYMQEVKLIADENEKIPDITNLQQMVKYPALMYDIIKYVLLESEEFTDNYDIMFSNEKLAQISKKKKEEKEATPAKLFETPWDQYKVAEDDNYITFELASYNGSLKNYYNKVFSEDDRITKQPNSGFLVTSWCVLSDRGYFESQRSNNSRNKWFFTFLKKNPIDFIISNLRRIGSISDSTKEAIISKLNNYSRLDEYIVDELRNDYLGECFLMHHSGEAYNYPSSNFGIHNYNNSPGSAIADSVLRVPKAYDYFSLKSVSEPFLISSGTLISYNFNEEEVTIPEGVVRIGTNAFRNSLVRVVNLPKSLTTIMAGAFRGCENLEEIRATNSLSYIQNTAFDAQSAHKLVLGVFAKESDGTITISKPVSLQHFPRNLFNHPDDLARYGILEDEPEEIEESKKSVIYEAVRLANKPLYNYENKNFSIEHGILSFKEEATNLKFGDLILPEGIKKLATPIFGNYNSIVFPSTFRGWEENSQPLLDKPTTSSVGTLDFSKASNIRVVQDQKFYFSNIKNLILPQSIIIIGKRAFFLTAARTIYIPSSVEEISPDAFKNTNISTIFTDNVELLTQKLESVQFRYKPEIAKI